MFAIACKTHATGVSNKLDIVRLWDMQLVLMRAQRTVFTYDFCKYRDNLKVSVVLKAI